MRTELPSRRSFRHLLDRIGAGASIVCAIHCALLPLIFGVLPALGLAFLSDHRFERLFVGFAIVLATFSLGFGWRQHGSYRAFWLLLPGIGLLIVGLLMDADHGSRLHAALVSIGGTLVALAHVINLRLTRAHVHGPACNH